MTTLAGCLAPEPPPYQADGQTPPLLDLGRAEPKPIEVLRLDTGAVNPTLSLNVPVRSEDAGDDLLAVLFLDYRLPDQEPQFPFAQVPASTFDDAGRAVALSWSYGGLSPGCRQLSLLVTHFSNFDFSGFLPRDERDLALATWWLSIDDDGTHLLGDCPRPEATP